MTDADYPDGLIVVVKRDCPTCVLVEPVLGTLADAVDGLHVHSQDDPSFPATAKPIDDRDLAAAAR